MAIAGFAAICQVLEGRYISTPRLPGPVLDVEKDDV